MACLLPLLSCCPLPEPLRANATRLLDCQAQIKLLTVGRRQMFVQHESTYNLQGQAARICLQDSQNGSTDHDANRSGGGSWQWRSPVRAMEHMLPAAGANVHNHLNPTAFRAPRAARRLQGDGGPPSGQHFFHCKFTQANPASLDKKP